jgi:hypothetical protein
MKRSRPTNSSKAGKLRRAKPQSVAELRALQRTMARAVMRPLTGGGRMRPEWSDGGSAKKAAAGFIKPGPRLTSFERLEIYNRQYWFRLFECLADDYPGVRALLGEYQFRHLAVAYLANYPSVSFTLRDLGRRLPDFIRAEPRWTAPRQEMAFDMARLEWSHIEAFDNEAKPPLSGGDVLGRGAAEIHLRLQPHITLLQLGWPLDEYLIALRDNSRRHEETSNAVAQTRPSRRRRQTPAPERAAVFLAVHRHGNLVYYKQLLPLQFRLLTELQKGASLERALGDLREDAAELAVNNWFQDWAALGWFWVPE